MKQETILIKTYLHDSGLFYLSKSLGDFLKKSNKNIIYVPKSKYILSGNMFKRTYINDNIITDKNEILIYFDENKSISEQIIKVINDHAPTTVISFETLMEKSQWINDIKNRFSIKVIDVPMIEWVGKKYLFGKKYNIFDEIYCLTDQCFNYFSEYKTAKKISWPFIDNNIFYKPKKVKDRKIIRFFHAGSLNPYSSSKNTDLVINAFNMFNAEYQNSELIISGIHNKDILSLAESNKKIYIENKIFDRYEIAEIYRNSDCIIMPSSREGFGLCLHEAVACGCSIITTNTPPMNECINAYLCNITGYKYDTSLVPHAVLTVQDIYNKIKEVYEDLNA